MRDRTWRRLVEPALYLGREPRRLLSVGSAPRAASRERRAPWTCRSTPSDRSHCAVAPRCHPTSDPRTDMHGCKGAMFEWWFGWGPLTREYVWWHPVDHVFSEWLDLTPGNGIGSTHIVDERL